HEAADPRACVDGGEDEQRLEHDREVVPERRGPAAERLAEDQRDAEGEGRCATGAGDEVLLDRGGSGLELPRGEREAETVDEGDRTVDRAAGHARRSVDGEVQALVD